MITKEHKSEKYCCLYVSEFHLEMILLPYIKNNINNANIIIKTENNLLDSVKKVLERINLGQEEKEKILTLNWNSKTNEPIVLNKDEKNIIIINGSNEYISKINLEVENLNMENVSTVECYNITKIDVKKINIKKDYDGVLNTNYIEK